MTNKIESYKNALSANQRVIVGYFASWCSPCNRVAPFFEDLSKENHGLLFVKVDVDFGKEISKVEKVKKMPTFKAFENSKEVDKLIGADEVAMRAFVDKWKIID